MVGEEADCVAVGLWWWLRWHVCNVSGAVVKCGCDGLGGWVVAMGGLVI